MYRKAEFKAEGKISEYNKVGKLFKSSLISSSTGEKLHWREINFNHCEEALSEHSCLKAQRKTYIRKKTCECYQCENAFIKNCALDLHKKTHSGENASEYNRCETAFNQNLHLVHKKTYTQENPVNALTVRKAYLLPHTLRNV